MVQFIELSSGYVVQYNEYNADMQCSKLIFAVALRGGTEGAGRPGWHHLKGWHQEEKLINFVGKTVKK